MVCTSPMVGAIGGESSSRSERPDEPDYRIPGRLRAQVVRPAPGRRSCLARRLVIRLALPAALFLVHPDAQAAIEPSLLSQFEVVRRSGIPTEDGPRTFVANEALFEGANLDKIFAQRPFSTTLWSRKRRLDCYEHAVRVAAQLASVDRRAETRHRMARITESMDPVLRGAEAFTALDLFDRHYVPGEFVLDRLRNHLSHAIRHMSPRSSGGVKFRTTNLEKLSEALILIDWGLTLGNYAYAAALEHALAGDAALERLDHIRAALERAQSRGAHVDPLWFEALEKAGENLVRDETYFGALILTMEQNRGEIAAKGVTTAYPIIIRHFQGNIAHYVKGFLTKVRPHWGSHRIASHASHFAALWTWSLMATYYTIDALLDQHERAQTSVAASTLDWLMREGARGQGAGTDDERAIVLQNQVTYFDKMRQASSGFLVGLHDFLARIFGAAGYGEARVYFRERKLEVLRKLQSLYGCGAGDLVLVLDSSGSMQSNDPHDFRKTASHFIINRFPDHARIGVVDFDGSARVVQDLRALVDGRNRAHNAVDQIDSEGSTCIRCGLDKAIDVLGGESGGVRPAGILLLTDGQDSPGGLEYGPVINRLTEMFCPVYAVGLGDDLNRELLHDLARQTGGLYFHAATVKDLADIFHQITTEMTCLNTVARHEGHIMQGREIDYTIPVEPGVEEAGFDLSWHGSMLDLVLYPPDGVALGDLEVRRNTGDTYLSVIIRNPPPGMWKVRVVGVDVPHGGEPFHLIADVAGGSTLSADRARQTAPADQSLEVRVRLDCDGLNPRSIRAEARVSSPDGRDRVISLRPVLTESSGQLEQLWARARMEQGATGESILLLGTCRGLPLPGDHRIRVTVEARTVDGQPIRRELFQTVRVSGASARSEQDELLGRLTSSRPTERIAALRALVETGTTAAMGAIQEMLGDPNADVRATAAWALEEMRRRTERRRPDTHDDLLRRGQDPRRSEEAVPRNW